MSPKAPVTNAAVPKPVAQSSVRLLPGSAVLAHVPSAHGKTGASVDHTAGMPSRVMPRCAPGAKP